MLIIGVDPGATGAIAAIFNGELSSVHDMPCLTLKVGGKDRRRVDAVGLATRFAFVDSKRTKVFIEQVGPNIRDGKAAAFAFGGGFRMIEQVCACFHIPYEFVLPNTWQRAVGCPKGKDGARARAAQIFPASAEHFRRVKDDGRADAVLIAHYGTMKCSQ